MSTKVDGGSSHHRAIGGFLVAALALSACGGSDTAAAEGPTDDLPELAAADADADYEPFTITWPAGIGPDTFLTGGSAGFEQAIAETSGGAIDVEVHYGAALGPLTEHGDMLRDGLADMTWILPAYEPEPYPINHWIMSAASISDPHPLLGDLQAYAASLEWGFNEHSVSEFEDQGLVPLLPTINGLSTYTLLCKEPVRTLEEAAGKRVRVSGDVHAGEAEALGMEPVFMPTPEVYEALERGVLDCIIQHARDIQGHGFLDAAQQVTIDDSGGGFSGFLGTGVYANKAWWDDLPVAAKQDIWDALIGFVDGQMTLNLLQDTAFFEEAQEVGEIHSFGEDMRAALSEHQKGVRESLVADPPNGVPQDLAAELLADFEEGHERWAGIAIDLGYGDTPSDWAEFGPQADSVDIQQWLDKVEQELLAPRRPA